MEATKAEQVTESKETVSVEAEAPAPGKIEAELPAGGIVPLINKVVAPPIEEISKLIDELKDAKTHLEAEGERIQREVDRYLQLSQNTAESIRMIAGAVTEWRSAGHPAE
jgi:hypothetical protein